MTEPEHHLSSGEFATRTGLTRKALRDQVIAQADRRQAMRTLVLRHVQATLSQGAQPVFEIHTRHVPARRFMSIQRRLHADQTAAFVREAKATFASHLRGTAPSGPLTLVFHGPVNEESDGPLEATLACPEEIAPSDAVDIRSEPAHDEAFTTITRVAEPHDVADDEPLCDIAYPLGERP